MVKIPKLSWEEIDNRNCIETLMNDPQRIVETQTADGPLQLKAGYFLFSAILLSALWRHGIPIPEELVFKKGLFSDKVRQDMHTSIMEILFSRKIYNDALGPYLEQMVKDVATLSNLISTNMAPWFKSIDLFAMAETMEIPEIKEVLESYKPETFNNLSINQIESEFKEYSKRVTDVFLKVKKGNCFYPFMKMGTLNNGQFVQLVGSAGTRSDVNERMFPIPLMNSYNSGHQTQAERALDSRSSVKSKFYNKQHMRVAQYDNRQIQLMSSSVMRIYGHDVNTLYGEDCGSQVHIPFHIPKGKSANMRGVNVLNKDGTYTQITRKNHKQFECTDVKIRSPLGCRHNDGFCQMCGGAMSYWLPASVNPGVNAALVVISKIVQTILSSKHLVTTKSSSYITPQVYDTFFRVHNNEVFIRKGANHESLSLGIPTDDVDHVSDLDYVTTPDLNDRFFSKITSVSLAETKTGRQVTPPVTMVGSDGCIPFFSEDYLLYLKDHPETILQNGDITWFRLDGVDIDKPIFKSNSVNESALTFLKRVMAKFLEENAKVKNAGVALNSLCNLIWERVDANILHISVMLKANMITSDTDMSIPVLHDPSGRGAKFGSFKEIIKNRHLGNQAAYQELPGQIVNPGFFTQWKTDSQFDGFMGYDDHIHPEKYGLPKAADRNILDISNTSSTAH